jgi:hypothetical protein
LSGNEVGPRSFSHLVQLEQTAGRLGNQGRVSVAEIERTIRERPLTALLAAFGAGLLFARLWDRR